MCGSCAQKHTRIKVVSVCTVSRFEISVPVTGSSQQPKNRSCRWEVCLQTQVQLERQKGSAQALGQARPARAGRNPSGRHRGRAAQCTESHKGEQHVAAVQLSLLRGKRDTMTELSRELLLFF